MIIYFSGAEESAARKKLLELGVRDLMFSFYYIRKQGDPSFVRKLKAEYPAVRLFLEPGVRSYCAALARRSDAELRPSFFVRAFEDYAGGNAEFFDLVVEPDFSGTPLAAEFGFRPSETLRSNLRRSGVPIAPVWQFTHGHSTWLDLCRNPAYPYLAMGKESGEMGYQRMLIQEAHAAGKKVHALGLAKFSTDLQQLPFDSVNSSLWLTGQKFGRLYVFQDGVFTQLSPANGRAERQKQFSNHHRRMGINLKKLHHSSPAETQRANIMAWRDLSQRLQLMRKIKDAQDA